MNAASKTVALACIGLFVSLPAFARTGVPDLPGGAKTTTGSGKATSKPRSHMKMMSKSKSKMHGHKAM